METYQIFDMIGLDEESRIFMEFEYYKLVMSLNNGELE